MPGEPSSRNTLIIFVVVVIAIAVAAFLLVTSRPDPVQITINPPLPTATSEPSATPSPITVYVTGAVAEPQMTVSLPVDSRVEDAINAVGGFADDADRERVNIAAILRDGDQVHVPFVGEDAPLPTPSDSGVVNINTATLEELDTLPGVGPALAQRIIDYREENGPFTSLDDLDEVSGIGPALLAEIEELVTFD